MASRIAVAILLATADANKKHHKKGDHLPLDAPPTVEAFARNIRGAATLEEAHASARGALRVAPDAPASSLADARRRASDSPQFDAFDATRDRDRGATARRDRVVCALVRKNWSRTEVAAAARAVHESTRPAASAPPRALLREHKTSSAESRIVDGRGSDAATVGNRRSPPRGYHTDRLRTCASWIFHRALAAPPRLPRG